MEHTVATTHEQPIGRTQGFYRGQRNGETKELKGLSDIAGSRTRLPVRHRPKCRRPPILPKPGQVPLRPNLQQSGRRYPESAPGLKIGMRYA